MGELVNESVHIYHLAADGKEAALWIFEVGVEDVADSYRVSIVADIT